MVKRVAGVGGGASSPLTFFSIFVSLKNRKVSSQTLAITANICHSKTSLSWPLGLAAHSRGDRARLSEPCCVLQDGQTPLHRASLNGYALVVEQLLAAGAVKDAKTKVRWAGDEGSDGAGSRGDTRRGGASLLFWFLFVSLVVLCLVKTCI